MNNNNLLLVQILEERGPEFVANAVQDYFLKMQDQELTEEEKLALKSEFEALNVQYKLLEVKLITKMIWILLTGLTRNELQFLVARWTSKEMNAVKIAWSESGLQALKAIVGIYMLRLQTLSVDDIQGRVQQIERAILEEMPVDTHSKRAKKFQRLAKELYGEYLASLTDSGRRIFAILIFLFNFHILTVTKSREDKLANIREKFAQLDIEQEFEPVIEFLMTNIIDIEAYAAEVEHSPQNFDLLFA